MDWEITHQTPLNKVEIQVAAVVAAVAAVEEVEVVVVEAVVAAEVAAEQPCHIIIDNQ